MDDIEISLGFSDVPLGRSLIESEPPSGLTISDFWGDALVCSDGSMGEVSIQVGITIKTGIIPLAVAVSWIVAQLRKRGREQTRIDKQDVRLEEPEIRRLIEDRLRINQLRDGQRSAEDDDLPKKPLT